MRKRGAIIIRDPNPVIYGRVRRPFYDKLKRSAKKSGRSMSEELAWLAEIGMDIMPLIQKKKPK